MVTVLDTVKTICGVSTEDDSFDNELLFLTNTALSTLYQEGSLSSLPFVDETTEWDSVSDDDFNLQIMETYLPLKVKSIFDPQTNSVVSQSITEQIKELEWRMYVNSQNKETTT